MLTQLHQNTQAMSHVELAVHSSPVNVQCVLVMVDTGAECSLINGNPEQFPRTPAVIDGYGGNAIRVKKPKSLWGWSV